MHAVFLQYDPSQWAALYVSLCKPKIPSNRCLVPPASPMQREQILKWSVGEKVKSEFSWLKKSLLRCALERHCLALKAERREWGVGEAGGFKFRAQNSPSWIRCSLSCRLRYITPTGNGRPSHSLSQTHRKSEVASCGVHWGYKLNHQ